MDVYQISCTSPLNQPLSSGGRFYHGGGLGEEALLFVRYPPTSNGYLDSRGLGEFQGNSYL